MSKRLAVLCTLFLISLAGLSAHMVKGLGSAGAASAFVSSPSAGSDAPIKIVWGTSPAGDTGLRVVCFFVANTSDARLDRAAWPRVTGVGFELPGAPSGFVLLSPAEGWELVEGTDASLPGHGSVRLDLAIVARANPSGKATGRPHDLGGIPPGQDNGIRGVGTRFCVSGPFPDRLPNLNTPDPTDTLATTIEGILDGVVVAFDGVDGVHRGIDAGVWFPAPGTSPRAVPLYQ